MKYYVLVTQKELYNFEVEAKDEEEARQIAYDFWDDILTNGMKSDYHYDSDSEIEITELG